MSLEISTDILQINLKNIHISVLPPTFADKSKTSPVSVAVNFNNTYCVARWIFPLIFKRPRLNAGSY